MLSMDALPRRDLTHDDERVAAILGGRHWLLRVWKRITALRQATLRLARRVVAFVQVLARGLRMPHALCLQPAAGCFRAVFLALRV